MDSHMALEVGSLDPDLLQLLEHPSNNNNNNNNNIGINTANNINTFGINTTSSSKPNPVVKLPLEELFTHWLSLPETQRLVRGN